MCSLFPEEEEKDILKMCDGVRPDVTCSNAFHELVWRRTENQDLPIHRACRSRASLDTIKLLLDFDVDNETIFQRNGKGDYPLHLACKHGASLDVIKLLLDHDPERKIIFKTDQGESYPIHCALYSGASIQVIEILLDCDPDNTLILTENKWGYLPIQIGLMNKAPLNVIKSLLDRDIEKKTIFCKSKDGSYPIHCACKFGASQEIIQLLLDCDHNDTLISTKNKRRKLPLFLACKFGASCEAIRSILHCHPDNQFIFPAVCHAHKGGASPEVIKLLYNQTIFQRNPAYEGGYPIHHACRHGISFEVIEFLLDCDPDNKLLFQADSYGYLPIHVAVRYGASYEVVELLLNSDPDNHLIYKKVKYRSGYPRQLPIHLACGRREPSLEIIRLLLARNNCNVTFLEYCGFFHVWQACRRLGSSHFEIIKLFLEYDYEHTMYFQFQNYVRGTLDNGLFPVDVAFKYRASFQVVQLLMHHETDGRMKHLRHIEFYSTKLSKVLNGLRKIVHDRRHKYNKYKDYLCKLVDQCHLIEQTTQLELAIVHHGMEHGVHVIMTQVVGFLHKKKDATVQNL